MLTHPASAQVLRVEVGDDLGDGVRLVVLSTHHQIDLIDGIEAAGEIPLPPYIHKALADPERYQTVYADRTGPSPWPPPPPGST